jgi:site-specific recombinase XerD
MPRRPARPSAKIRDLRDSWKRALLAENKSPSTVAVYTSAVDRLADYLEANHGAATVAEIERSHVEGFVTGLLETRAPATASNRYRALQAFFVWCIREGELERSPMETMRPPQVPETPVPVLTEDQLRALLKACEGRSFEDRRDTAIVRVLIDTGMRRGELAGMGSRMSTSTRAWRSSSARDVDRAPVRSAARLQLPWIATCENARTIPTRT